MYSSSYIIGTKSELTGDLIEEAIGVELLSPFSEISDEIVQFILKESKKYTVSEYMNLMCIQEYKIPDIIRYIVSHNMYLYYGEIHSNRNLKPGAMAFIAMGINYKSNNIVFKKESYG